MSLVKYQIFSQVVELGSLTKAGETLNMTQSAVSHAVSSLEAEFGLSLLKRSKSGVLLTADGERLLPHIRQVLQRNEKLNQEVAALKGVEVGTVKLGTFSSVTIHWLPYILREFQRECPGIDVKLLDGNHAEMEKMLMDGTVDLGFITLPAREEFHLVPLRRDRMMCIMPMEHPFGRLAAIKPEQLKDEPFIMPVSGCSADVQKIFSQHQLQPNIKYELEGDHAIIAMVLHGLGISILPEMAVSHIHSDVCCRPIEGEYERTIGIAISSSETASPAAKKLYQYILQWSSRIKP